MLKTYFVPGRDEQVRTPGFVRLTVEWTGNPMAERPALVPYTTL
jgi:hypothetical protein